MFGLKNDNKHLYTQPNNQNITIVILIGDTQ